MDSVWALVQQVFLPIPLNFLYQSSTSTKSEILRGQYVNKLPILTHCYYDARAVFVIVLLFLWMPILLVLCWTFVKYLFAGRRRNADAQVLWTHGSSRSYQKGMSFHQSCIFVQLPNCCLLLQSCVESQSWFWGKKIIHIKTR